MACGLYERYGGHAVHPVRCVHALHRRYPAVLWSALWSGVHLHITLCSVHADMQAAGYTHKEAHRSSCRDHDHWFVEFRWSVCHQRVLVH